MSSRQEVFTDVLRRRRGALVGYAHLFTADRASAEDLVQEAFVRTFSGTRPLRDAGAAEAYLRHAIRSAFLDGARRRSRWRTAAPLLLDDPGAGRDVADQVAAGADVTAALALLPPQQRACVVLRYFDDLTTADVAAELGLGVGTVKRYLFEATARLRELLGTDLPADDDADHLLVEDLPSDPAPHRRHP